MKTDGKSEVPFSLILPTDYPLDIERKLNINNTLRGLPGRLTMSIYVLCPKGKVVTEAAQR